MNFNSLGDYIADRTESLQDSFIKEYFIKYRKEQLERLLDSEQYLLEGSRGVGKTMLMKYAALETEENFEKTSCLGVWINFEESIRLERIKVVEVDADPFLQWTMGKILLEVLSKIKELKPNNVDGLVTKLESIFGINSSDNSYEKYFNLLQEYISILEVGDIEDNAQLKLSTSKELIKILDNPYSFKQFLKELINDFSIKRLILLFDEAAHVFSGIQQEKFFTFFKSLRDPLIACKAAVYPGITNYGKSFERGQDAKEINISWSPTSKDDIEYIKSILKKRIQTYNPDYWHKLTVDSDIINTVCICSNGNPRFAFHIIDELEMNKAFQKSKISKQILIKSIRGVLDSKWGEFGTLQYRLVRYKKHIIAAEKMIKNFLIVNIKEWNKKRLTKHVKNLSAGFYIATNLFDEIKPVIEVLAYANLVIIDYQKKSIGQKHYGYYLTFNPSLLFSDDIVASPSDFSSVSIAIENNQAYYLTTPYMKELLLELTISEENCCTNNKCDFVTNDNLFIYCPQCGSKIKQRNSDEVSLYKILRSHSIDNLRLSHKMVIRLNEKFNNVGEIYDATLDDIKMHYIKDVRSEKIKNAAIEYMAG